MDKIEKALLKAKHAGAQEERERILVFLNEHYEKRECNVSNSAIEGDCVCRELHEKLKSELEARQ